jgi:hypothetical protein
MGDLERKGHSHNSEKSPKNNNTISSCIIVPDMFRMFSDAMSMELLARSDPAQSHSSEWRL